MGNIFEEYAILEAEEKAIKAKKEQLRPFILKRMIDDGIDKLETSVGKFSISKLKKWEYPAQVTELEDKYKAAKALSESTGEATYTETDSLRFIIAKL